MRENILRSLFSGDSSSWFSTRISRGKSRVEKIALVAYRVKQRPFNPLKGVVPQG